MLQDDRDRAEYDRLTYSDADVQRLAATQRDVAGQFALAQARFDATGEQFEQLARPQLADYQAATVGYQQTADQARALSEPLAANQQLRQELDGLARLAPTQIERARQRLASAGALLDPLAGAIADRDGVLASLRGHVAQAEAESARPRPGWLALVRLAQAANAEADAALAGALRGRGDGQAARPGPARPAAGRRRGAARRALLR